MLFFKKTKRLKSINATYIGLSQIASYAVALQEQYGFKTLGVKTINKEPRSRRNFCEFHDLDEDETLREFFKDRTPKQIEDEINATPFHPFEAKTDDSGMSIITKVDSSSINMEVQNEHSRFISKKAYDKRRSD